MEAEDALRDNPSGADTLRTLRDEKFPLLLDGFVDIVTFVGAVRFIIMRDVVDVVLLKKLWSDDPWAVGKDFIHPFAMSDCLCALGAGQDSETFALVGLSVACHADEEISLGECGFRLF